MTDPKPRAFPRGIAGVIVACLIPLLNGCIVLDQEIEITGEKHGVFRISVVLPASVYHHYRDRANGAGETHPAFFLDPTHGREYFPEKEGFRVTHYRVFEQDDRAYVRIEGRITDLQRAFASGKLGDFMYSRRDDGTWLLQLNLAESTRVGGADQANIEADVNEMREILDGLQLTLKIIVPREIVDTSATQRDKRAVQWTFDTRKNDAFLRNPPRLYVYFQ